MPMVTIGNILTGDTLMIYSVYYKKGVFYLTSWLLFLWYELEQKWTFASGGNIGFQIFMQNSSSFARDQKIVNCESFYQSFV